MGQVFQLIDQPILEANEIGYYSNHPDRWCLEYFNLSEDYLNRIYGITRHFHLSKAAQRSKRHIQWKKPSITSQAIPYLPADFIKPLIILLGGIIFILAPLAVIYGFFSAIEFFYTLGGVGIAVLFLLLIKKLFFQPTGMYKGKSLAIDNLTLYSSQQNISCRPDRILKLGKWIIPEEWKSHKIPTIGDILQLATQLLVIEEHYKQCPPFGVLIMGDGRQYKIKNTTKIRQKLLDTVLEMRAVIHHLDNELGEIPQK